MTRVLVGAASSTRSVMENKDFRNKFFAGGFLYNPVTQEVLLHLRDGNTKINPHKWGVFGGTSEGVESPEECCVREWNEELGIKVEPAKLIPLTAYLNTEHNTWRYVFYMESSLKKQQMTLGEGADFDWISMKTVFGRDLTNSTRKDLEYFLGVIKNNSAEV